MRALLLLLLPLAACAAGRSTYFLLTAEQAYQHALEAGAAERAPYEATLAEEYLRKAREENGYSDYGASERLCKASVAFSAKALEAAEEQGVPLDRNEEFVPEQRIDEPEPAGEDFEIDLDDP